MAVTGITLTDPDRGLSTVILPRTGVAWQGLGATATVRVVSEAKVGSDGASDSTQHLDDAAVSLPLTFYATTRALLDEIGGYLHPARRPVLVVTDDEWAQPRQLMLRYDSGTAPIEVGKGLTRDVLYQFRAPSGIWEQAGDPVELIVPMSIPSTEGIHIGSAGMHIGSGGLDMVATTQAGEFSYTNLGNLPSQWQGFLYGPCTGPALYHDTSGLALVWPSDTQLQPGDYILVDSAAKTAYLNSDFSQPLAPDWSRSDWFLIQDGPNLIRYTPAAGQAGAEAVLFYRPGWLPQ